MTTPAKRGRGRPPTTKVREQHARATLLAAVMEELLVADGRTPRGKTSMTRSMKQLHRKVATDAKASLRWVEAAWQQCRKAVINEFAAEVARKLNGGQDHSDARLEHDQQMRREKWASERAAADAAWAERLVPAKRILPKKRRT